MARLPRVVVPGLPHHVTQRGNRRQPTFFSDDDYAEYRRSLSLSCRACETRVLAYCFMPNHVHLILVPATEFGLRDVLMDERHLIAAARYVELNPVRARWCQRPEDWAWSSARDLFDNDA